MTALNSEMLKLREELDRQGIPWRDDSSEDSGTWIVDDSVARTKFKVHGEYFTAAHGYATLGGWLTSKDDDGLIELLLPNGGYVGQLKANTVIRIAQEWGEPV